MLIFYSAFKEIIEICEMDRNFIIITENAKSEYYMGRKPNVSRIYLKE